VKITNLHEYQVVRALVAACERKPLKIPHNLENGLIIRYPSPLDLP
jgi:hypothetical protein